MSDSFYHTNQTDILAYIDGIIPDGLIKDLTGQVVSLPIYSIQNHNMINYPWVSPVGELNKVLFHLYYTILYYTILKIEIELIQCLINGIQEYNIAVGITKYL